MVPPAPAISERFQLERDYNKEFGGVLSSGVESQELRRALGNGGSQDWLPHKQEAIAIYDGVVGFTVNQRMKELGLGRHWVRTVPDILWLLLSTGTKPVVVAWPPGPARRAMASDPVAALRQD